MDRVDRVGVAAHRRLFTYIVFGQQARAELHVVVKLETFAGFELLEVGVHDRRIAELSHAPHTSKLAVGILRGESRSSSRSATVVIVVGVVRWSA